MAAGEPYVDLPIDLVYTWVDGDDPAHRQLSRQYAGAPPDLNPERTRDVYHMLKYSLRSVALFAPWIRHLYVVTCRPQAPAWLDTGRADVRVVHHDEIFDDPQYLPTFSCHVIESYIHRIPGLSAYFLYMNDDFLLGRPVTPGDFLTDDRRILMYGTLFGERIPFVFDNWKNDLVSFLQHAPLMIYKPYYEEMLEAWAEDVGRTRSRRFRTRQDVMLHGLYRYYCLTEKSAQTQAVPAYRYRKYYRFHKITNNYPKQKRQLEQIKTMRPKFYCMNDDQKDNPNGDVVHLVRTFLHDYYPEKSPYER